MPTENNFGNPGAGSGGSTLSNTLSDASSQLKNKAAQLGQSATDKANEGRHAAAGGLASAAASLHDSADGLPGGERVSGLAHSAADKMSSAADYIKSHDVDAVMEDLQTLVKNNPVPAMLTAAAVGFLLGRLFSNND
ncbi:MAG: hypothetical protein M3O06_03230 [Pseudomonadota bacterium]|nr:hypothetical protein [Pseudomonadota bacterium]